MLLVAIITLGTMTFYATLNIIITKGFKTLENNPIPILGKTGKIVVLVPVRDDPSIFNSYPYLKAMDYPDYTICIVDDSLDPNFKGNLGTLCDDKTFILRRPDHKGRKSGALNFALDTISNINPKYVVIFDADHRPTTDFLKKAVNVIEISKVNCVCGYQKHDIGRHDLFGKFYEASQAAGIINFQGRNQLGLATIFGGGCGIFEYQWLKKKKFDVTSITEDWELSLRGYLQKDFSILIRNDLFAHAAIPRNYKWFITQQLRWSEGTISDFRKHFKSFLRAEISWKTRLGIIFQGFYYTSAWAVLLSWILLLFKQTMMMPLTLGLLMFYGGSWAYTYWKGAQLEGFSPTLTIKCLLLGFAVSHLMTPIYCYSTLRGVILRRTDWIVTRRRG